MGISAGLNLGGTRPGVCTSSTRPTAPYEGQMIYETDTNRVLVWDNAAWVMIADTDTPPGLQLVKTQTIGSGVSSVTVTGAFSAEWDNYRITLSGSVNSANAEIRMRLGSTTTGYFQNVIYTAWNNTIQAASTNNGNIWSITGAADPDGSMASFDIFNPYLATRTMCGGPFVGADTDRVGGYMSGFLANTIQYTDFTFDVGSGTMTGGTIRVYGYRN